MKKTLLKSTFACFTFVLCLFGMNSSAQDAVFQNEAERAPLAPEAGSPNVSSRTAALWDVLFNYDMSVAGVGGYAGVCFVGNEYWVSKWQSDTIAILSASGAFVRKVRINGVTGVRSMTYDGAFVYAGVNTTSVKKINPISTGPTLAGTINMPSITGGSATNTGTRFISYDPTANAGAGGFWIGNFDTDLIQVSMTGAILNSITSTSHGIPGMYSAVIDNNSAGGPFLWVCDQGATLPGVANLIQVSTATGLQTGVMHDVLSDVGLVSTGGLGGGLYLHTPTPGPLTLVGCLQGTPNRVYGYDMNVLVGLDEPSANGEFLSVTPSVSNSYINIKLDKQNNNEASIRIVDAAGKVVFDRNSKGLNNYLDVSSYSNGIYFVNVKFENGSYNTKFVKN